MAGGGFAEALLAGGGGAELDHKEADGIGATTEVGAPPPSTAAGEANNFAEALLAGGGGAELDHVQPPQWENLRHQLLLQTRPAALPAQGQRAKGLPWLLRWQMTSRAEMDNKLGTTPPR